MAERSGEKSDGIAWTKMLDENEQLRTTLEASLEENSRLMDDRNRLLVRVSALARELQSANSAHARTVQQNSEVLPMLAEHEKRSQTEEELRVAFEELQVLTEELEVANTSLHQTNLDLDAKVGERTGELAASNASLRETERALRAIADLVPDLLWRTDQAGKVTWYNKRWYDYTGQSVEQAMGFGWADAVHPADRAVSHSLWMVSVGSGKPYMREHRIKGRDGHYRWFLVRAEPVQERGSIVQWFGAVTDIHDQRIAMNALQQSELRFRVLVEGMPQLVWRAVDGGKWTWSSPQWTAYTGLSAEESLVMGWLHAVHPDDREEVRAAWERANAAEPINLECRIYHAGEGRYRHFRSRATAANDGENKLIEWLGTCTDVDDLVQLQAQQSVLVAELQHRTRNLMAVVQSVTMRTIKGSETLEGFRACIADRLSALARVQSLLSRREEGMRVSFDVLVREELSAHVTLDASGNGNQVTLQGPPGIQLRSANVQTLALALHELATNAVKYGALSTHDGHLNVVWSVKEEQQGPVLHVKWCESGVRNMPEPGASPQGSGYGRELIERALPFQLGARTAYAFAEDGVHCSIEMPVPEQKPTKERIHG